MDNRIKILRFEKNLSIKEIANYLNIPYNEYLKIENGKADLSIITLNTLADLFDTSTDYILKLTDERKPYPKSILFYDSI